MSGATGVNWVFLQPKFIWGRHGVARLGCRVPAGGVCAISEGYVGRSVSPGVNGAARVPVPGQAGWAGGRAVPRPAGRPGSLLAEEGAAWHTTVPLPRPPERSRRVTRLLGWLAAGGIGGAILVMLALSAAGPSRAVIHLHPSQAGPLLSFRLHPPQMLVAIATWSAVVTGGAGVAAGLAAVARGARPSARLLAGAALAAAAVFTVLPSAGSTDTLDYASYGRMVATGHDPYVMTPLQLRRSGDPIGRVAPHPWQRVHSVYGPLATVEQAAAAELGGTSPGWIIFWLKLWNLFAFAAVVIGLDRLLRRDRVRRLRAHLLWSLNPLLLWVLMASGHVDAFAAAFGFLGVLLLRPSVLHGGGADGGGADGGREPFAPLRFASLFRRSGLPGPRPRLAECDRRGPAAPSGPEYPGLARSRRWGRAGRRWLGTNQAVVRGVLAGGLIGAAADLKITFILFGLGAVWAGRRSPRMLAALAAGALVVLVPSYLWFGPPAVTVLLDHSTATGDNLYRLFVGFPVHGDPRLTLVALPVLAATALLLMRRMPDGYPALPAVRPAFVLALAWLLTWPYQRPWYDAMVFCLLALYPASRLDWPLIARLVAGVIYSTPGMPGTLTVAPLGGIEHVFMVFVVPAIRLAALLAVVMLCLTGAWYAGEPLRLRLAGLLPGRQRAARLLAR